MPDRFSPEPPDTPNDVVQEIKERFDGVVELLEDVALSLDGLSFEQMQQLSLYLAARLVGSLSPEDVEVAQNSPHEYLLKYKNRLGIITHLQEQIFRGPHSIPVETDRGKIFLTVADIQMTDRGVLFYEGFRPFEGYGVFVYLASGEVCVMVTNREIPANTRITEDYVKFLPIEKRPLSRGAVPPHALNDLDKPIKRLSDLLEKEINVEAEYQEVIQDYPWLFGAQYASIDAHRNLNHKNIPDFTAIRVKDRNRDIIEIKPPFTPIFRKDGQPSANFLSAIDQISRYIDFAEQEASYLRSEGLQFSGPVGYLLVGINLSDDQKKFISRFERQNRSLKIITYNDLVSYATHTVAWLRSLKEQQNQVEALTERRDI